MGCLGVKLLAPYGWGLQLNNWPGFTATAGTKSISFWGRLIAGENLEATMTVRSKDLAGADLQVDTISILALHSAWQQVRADVVAPAGTARLSVEMSGKSGQGGDALEVDQVYAGS